MGLLPLRVRRAAKVSPVEGLDLRKRRPVFGAQCGARGFVERGLRVVDGEVDELELGLLGGVVDGWTVGGGGL